MEKCTLVHLKVEDERLLDPLAMFSLIYSPNVQLNSETMKCIASEGYTQ